MRKRIHIFGASGSGTTTIAKIACEKITYKHFDADDYFWLPTKAPFTAERPRDECLQLMENDLLKCDKWVLSGSVTGWGDIFIPLFDLVVFVYIAQDTRLERLRKRERERYGNAILPSGSRHEESEAFLEWAAAYDTGTRNGRSLPKHEAWLKQINCPVLRITNNVLNDSLDAILNAIYAK
jgi:adenylate kinase family enzyme